MLVAAIPSKVTLPFANSAGPSFKRQVPNASQIGIQPGAASFTDGFPPQCFDPVGAGGTPPWGADFNGLLNQMSAWTRWQAAGGPVPYDGTFSTDIGGYPKGAVVKALAEGYYWYSTTDENVTDPEAGGAGWWSFSIFGQTTGGFQWRPTEESLPGYIRANGLTIGNAVSGATGLASASAQALYVWHWNNFPNTQCPVSGGRGANALADFNAGKPIQVLDLRGTGIGGMDTMGGGATTRLSGVTVVSGSATQAGSILGSNLHALNSGENGTHTHVNSLNDPTHSHTAPVISTGLGFQTAGGGATAAVQYSVQTTSNGTGITINNASSGGSSPHNTYERNMLGSFYMKL